MAISQDADAIESSSACARQGRDDDSADSESGSGLLSEIGSDTWAVNPHSLMIEFGLSSRLFPNSNFRNHLI